MAWLRFLANHRIDICIPRKRHHHDEPVVAMVQAGQRLFASGIQLASAQCAACGIAPQQCIRWRMNRAAEHIAMMQL